MKRQQFKTEEGDWEPAEFCAACKRMVTPQDRVLKTCSKCGITAKEELDTTKGSTRIKRHYVLEKQNWWKFWCPKVWVLHTTFVEFKKNS